MEPETLPQYYLAEFDAETEAPMPTTASSRARRRRHDGATASPSPSSNRPRSPGSKASAGTVVHGAEIAPGEPAAERDDYGEVVLAQRLRDALARLNPALPAEALDDAFRKLTRPEGADARSRATARSTACSWTA